MSFYDLTQNMSTSGKLLIKFTHVPTNENASFQAFIESWQDQFKQEWSNSADSIGRMDSVRLYKKTSRQLNFLISIPSASPLEAAENLEKMQTLIQMCYPTFEKIKTSSQSNSSNNVPSGGPEQARANNAANQIGSPQVNSSKNEFYVMASPPFFNISFANWARNWSSIGPISGLYGTIDGINFQPEFDSGIHGNHIWSRDAGSSAYAGLVPTILKLSINMTVLNVEKLGFRANPEGETISRTPNFPYGANEIKKGSIEQTKKDNELIQKASTIVTEPKKSNSRTLSQVAGDWFNDLFNNRK